MDCGDSFQVQSADGIATVTLTGTTMPPRFFRDCTQLFGQLAEQQSLRAVVVRGDADKGFTFGLDLRAVMAEHGPLFAGGGATERHALHRLIRELQQAFTAIQTCPVPVIAAVHGWCIGGGIDLITACDMRLATNDAMFSVRETKIAIVADLGTLQRLPQIVGQGHARELAFTGRDFDAAHAHRIGLVNELCADRAALDSAAQQLARDIASNAPLTVRGVKAVMNYSADRPVEAGLEYVAAWNSAFLATEDLGEAITAFAQKRAPVFKGR